MNNDIVKELGSIFRARHVAHELNVLDFPYSEATDVFNEKLKLYLKTLFGEEIRFDREETFAYIQAHYKSVPIEINTYGGIILTVEDIEREDIVQELMEVFSGVVGLNPLCRYNFCSNICGITTVYPTIEWNLGPEERLNEIIKGYMTVPGSSWIRDIEDYYTGSIIESLGTELFTFDGYKKLFMSRYNDYKNVNHRVNQIQKLNPNLGVEAIHGWLNSCRKTMNVSKDRVKQLNYMDDGK